MGNKIQKIGAHKREKTYLIGTAQIASPPWEKEIDESKTLDITESVQCVVLCLWHARAMTTSVDIKQI